MPTTVASAGASGVMGMLTLVSTAVALGGAGVSVGLTTSVLLGTIVGLVWVGDTAGWLV